MRKRLMTLRDAVRIYPRPWIDGDVTFQEWMLAGAIILAAIAKDETSRRVPAGDEVRA